MAGYAGYMGGQAVASMIDNAMQYGMTRSMMQYQNDYNSPVNQVNRLKAAGLSSWNINPSGNTSAQPVVMPSNISSAVGSEADRRLSSRQLDIQENLSSAQADRERSQSDVNQTLAETNRMLLKYLPKSEEERIRSMKTGSDYTEKQISRYDETIDQQLKTQKSQEVVNYANSERAKADVNRIKSLLPHEVSKLIAETNELYANIAVLKTQADLNNAQISNTISMFIKNMEEVDKIGLESWMMKYQKTIIEKTGIKPGTPPWTALTDMFARIRYDLGNKKPSYGSW